jgi:hypothetical protein
MATDSMPALVLRDAMPRSARRSRSAIAEADSCPDGARVSAGFQFLLRFKRLDQRVIELNPFQDIKRAF